MFSRLGNVTTKPMAEVVFATVGDGKRYILRLNTWKSLRFLFSTPEKTIFVFTVKRELTANAYFTEVVSIDFFTTTQRYQKVRLTQYI